MAKYPKNFQTLAEQFGEVMERHAALGEAARRAGPLSEGTAHLIQLAAAATSRSEGAVHSHVRRALESGARAEEIYHSLILLVSTIGFPATAAAMSWARDEIEPFERARKKGARTLEGQGKKKRKKERKK